MTCTLINKLLSVNNRCVGRDSILGISMQSGSTTRTPVERNHLLLLPLRGECKARWWRTPRCNSRQHLRRITRQPHLAIASCLRLCPSTYTYIRVRIEYAATRTWIGSGTRVVVQLPATKIVVNIGVSIFFPSFGYRCRRSSECLRVSSWEVKYQNWSATISRYSIVLFELFILRDIKYWQIILRRKVSCRKIGSLDILISVCQIWRVKDKRETVFLRLRCSSLSYVKFDRFKLKIFTTRECVMGGKENQRFFDIENIQWILKSWRYRFDSAENKRY